MNNSERNKTIHQDPKERIQNFKEVSLGFDEKLMLAEADRCLGCKAAPCRKGCPVGIDIPAFIARLKQNDVDGAVESISKDTLLPAICGRVCPQEKQCENFCVRKAKLGVERSRISRYLCLPCRPFRIRKCCRDKTYPRVSYLSFYP